MITGLMLHWFNVQCTLVNNDYIYVINNRGLINMCGNKNIQFNKLYLQNKTTEVTATLIGFPWFKLLATT